jgi:hypothetical protein
LRREFMAFYPYLATLRVQGGEALAYAGFRELLEDGKRLRITEANLSDKALT